MRLAAFAERDLKRMVGDRRALVVNLVLPLLLTSIMGLSFGANIFGQEKGISAIPVALVADEMPDFLRERLLSALEDSGFFAAVWADSAGADAMVRSGDVAAAIVLPPRVWADFFDADSLTIAVWKDPASDIKAGIVEEIVRRGVLRLQAGEAAYRTLWPEDYRTAAEDSSALAEIFDGGFADIWQRLREPQTTESRTRAVAFMARQADHQVALSRAMASPVIKLDIVDKAPGADSEKSESSLYDYFLPSFAVFFLMMAVAAGARDLHRERDRRTLQRQLLGPGAAWPIIVGKWAGSVLQGWIMLAVLLLAGALLFRVNLGPNLWSLPLVMLLTCTTASGFFMLLALVVSREKLLQNLSTVVILVSGMIGGNFMPVDNLPEWARAAGQWTFNYWANLSFTRVIVDDLGLAAIGLPLAVLGGASAILLVAVAVLFQVRAGRGGWA